MKFIVTAGPDALAWTAADLVAAAVAERPDAAILTATGNTPMGLYAELAARARVGTFDPSGLRVFQLDEYAGVPADDYRSLCGWTRRSFIDPLGIDPNRVTWLRGDAADLDAACAAYANAVRNAGGYDLAILGLGPNGHLGFNEPPSTADAPTRALDLTQASIVSNGPYWGGEDKVPRRALTAGMDLILAARTVLLLVSGAHKRDILHRAMRKAPTAEVPASWLQRAGNVVVIADRAAT